MKKKGICASILPNRNIQAEVFWRIISYTPFGVYPYSCLVLIEELEQIFLSLRLTFHIDFFENFIDQLKTDP